jgi:hypothetical protein
MLDAFHTQVHVRIGLAALRRRAATPTCLLTASRQPVCRNSGCLKMEVPRSEPERSSPLCLGRVLARCRFLFAPAPHATPPSLRRPQLRSSAPLRGTPPGNSLVPAAFLPRASRGKGQLLARGKNGTTWRPTPLPPRMSPRQREYSLSVHLTS